MLVTMSEFGRTARENGNRGTDHGHANVMFALGGRCAAAKSTAAGRAWRREVLYEGRDLDLTTDYRTRLRRSLARHYGVKASSAKCFPSFRATELPGAS